MDPSEITPNTPAMRPPPGVESNFVNPRSQETANIILHTICLVLTTLFLVMRLYTRHFISHWLGWDDCIQALFVSEIFYIPLVSVVKSSFLVFFERVFFPSQKMKYCARFGLVAIWVFYTALFFRSIWLCDPLEKVFNPTLPGHCLQKNVTPYLSGFFNTISDFYILVLPLPFIWGLNMKASRRLRLIAVFSAGIL
ncbi:MAG: hypothetical protein Q9207_002102 [Kuettlingeria erythrocarpa]